MYGDLRVAASCSPLILLASVFTAFWLACLTSAAAESPGSEFGTCPVGLIDRVTGDFGRATDAGGVGEDDLLKLNLPKELLFIEDLFNIDDVEFLCVVATPVLMTVEVEELSVEFRLELKLEFKLESNALDRLKLLTGDCSLAGLTISCKFSFEELVLLLR